MEFTLLSGVVRNRKVVAQIAEDVFNHPHSGRSNLDNQTNALNGPERYL